MQNLLSKLYRVSHYSYTISVWIEIWKILPLSVSWSSLNCSEKNASTLKGTDICRRTSIFTQVRLYFSDIYLAGRCTQRKKHIQIIPRRRLLPNLNVMQPDQVYRVKENFLQSHIFSGVIEDLSPTWKLWSFYPTFSFLENHQIKSRRKAN